MDCPTEERLIRMALEPLEDVLHVDVDLDARNIEVTHQDENFEGVLHALLPLKFGERLLATHEVENFSPVLTSLSAEKRVLQQLLWINGAMFLVELVGGILANSTGLLADSLDMLGDAFVYGVALAAVGKEKKKQAVAAKYSGWIQLVLVTGVFVEVVRRFIYGAAPDSSGMIVMALLALAANLWCVWLLRSHKDGGVHMKASWIFSTNDAIANVGIIVAGILVGITGSPLPDLVIGLGIVALVGRGALRILRLAAHQ